MPKLPRCPSCKKEVHAIDQEKSLGHSWHKSCLKCDKCTKRLRPERHLQGDDGKAYCNNGTCYSPSSHMYFAGFGMTCEYD